MDSPMPFLQGWLTSNNQVEMLLLQVVVVDISDYLNMQLMKRTCY